MVKRGRNKWDEKERNKLLKGGEVVGGTEKEEKWDGGG